MLRKVWVLEPNMPGEGKDCACSVNAVQYCTMSLTHSSLSCKRSLFLGVGLFFCCCFYSLDVKGQQEFCDLCLHCALAERAAQ